MVQELETLARRARKSGVNAEFVAYLRGGVRLGRKLEVSESLPDLSLEWNSRAQNLAIVFAKKLGFKTEEEYIATLPKKFKPQPEEWKGRFDIPLIVETRLPLEEMLPLIGIVVSFDVNRIKDWKKEYFQTPHVPYTTWANDGTVNLDKSVDMVRNALKIDERGGTVYDGSALYLRDRTILNRIFPDFPGSMVGDHAPNLFQWRGRPRTMRSRWTSKANPRFGSMTCGKTINLRKAA